MSMMNQSVQWIVQVGKVSRVKKISYIHCRKLGNWDRSALIRFARKTQITTVTVFGWKMNMRINQKRQSLYPWIHNMTWQRSCDARFRWSLLYAVAILAVYFWEPRCHCKAVRLGTWIRNMDSLQAECAAKRWQLTCSDRKVAIGNKEHVDSVKIKDRNDSEQRLNNGYPFGSNASVVDADIFGRRWRRRSRRSWSRLWDPPILTTLITLFGRR